jgi:hypothetical protein
MMKGSNEILSCEHPIHGTGILKQERDHATDMLRVVKGRSHQQR